MGDEWETEKEKFRLQKWLLVAEFPFIIVVYDLSWEKEKSLQGSFTHEEITKFSFFT